MNDYDDNPPTLADDLTTIITAFVLMAVAWWVAC
jgi:hypothetical protein